jgi:hypothetical protein
MVSQMMAIQIKAYAAPGLASDERPVCSLAIKPIIRTIEKMRRHVETNPLMATIEFIVRYVFNWSLFYV